MTHRENDCRHTPGLPSACVCECPRCADPTKQRGQPGYCTCPDCVECGRATYDDQEP